MTKKLLIFGLLGLITYSCQSENNEGLKAVANVEAKGGSNVSGSVIFIQTDGAVEIVADIHGLTPGKHGFHIHEHGDCSASDASSAGGHFNPTGKPHGGPNDSERHIGDLGNLEADQEGVAHYHRLDHVISLSGDYSIIGKSIVIHDGEDDLTSQPSGDAGKRIGCGPIEVLE